MGEVKHVSIDTPIEEILQILDDDAGLIIDNFLDEDGLERIKSDLKPYLNQAKLSEFVMDPLMTLTGL